MDKVLVISDSILENQLQQVKDFASTQVVKLVFQVMELQICLLYTSDAADE